MFRGEASELEPKVGRSWSGWQVYVEQGVAVWVSQFSKDSQGWQQREANNPIRYGGGEVRNSTAQGWSKQLAFPSLWTVL